MIFIRDSKPVARKRYECLACFELSEADCFDPNEPLFHWSKEDREVLMKLKEDQYINIGEKYYHQVYSYDGEICSFRAKLEAHRLFLKYVYES